MLEFKQKGVAIVFVSHNLQAVNMLCQRCLFVAGRTMALGPTPDVIRQYTERAHGTVADAATDLVARHIALTRAGAGADSGTDGVPPGAPMRLDATFEARRAFGPLTFLFRVRRSTDALTVYDAHFEAEMAGAGPVQSGDRLRVRIDFQANLTRGMYFVECRVLETSTMTLPSNLGPLGTFSIEETTTWDGIAHLDAAASATVEPVGEREPAVKT
jgi:hypothetical protein